DAESPQADLAAAVAAVPPDLVAMPVGPGEVVADGQVLHGDPAGLPDDDAVTAGTAIGVLERGAGGARPAGGPVAAVNDDTVPVQAPGVPARLLGPNARPGALGALLVVDAPADQEPGPRVG